MSETISVIVPVYNVENYLRKCINSLLMQTYQPLQIILIDDGSTDASGDICDEYMKLYNNISVIHKKNEGQSVARNIGIDNSKGEWLLFIDSDDWIEPTFCEVLYKAASENNADISMCKTRIVNEDGKCLSALPDSDKTIEMNYEEIIEGLKTQQVVRFEVWNKLWRKSTVGNIRFIKGQISEEVHFDRLVFPKVNRYIFVDKTLHNYLSKRPGNTNSTYKKNRDCVFQEFDKWALELLSNHQEALALLMKQIAMQFAVIMYTEAYFFKESKQERKRLKRLFEKYYKEKNVERNTNMRLFYAFPEIYCKLLRLKAHRGK